VQSPGAGYSHWSQDGVRLTSPLNPTRPAFSPFQLEGPFGVLVSGRTFTKSRLLSGPSSNAYSSLSALFGYWRDYTPWAQFVKKAIFKIQQLNIDKSRKPSYTYYNRKE
jgi:hypothetical protein